MWQSSGWMRLTQRAELRRIQPSLAGARLMFWCYNPTQSSSGRRMDDGICMRDFTLLSFCKVMAVQLALKSIILQSPPASTIHSGGSPFTRALGHLLSARCAWSRAGDARAKVVWRLVASSAGLSLTSAAPPAVILETTRLKRDIKSSQ